MKFTLSWLKDHLDTTASLDELETSCRRSASRSKRRRSGQEARRVHDRARLETKQHPNADACVVAQVEIAKGKAAVEVVCGAANCHAGMLAVFAPLGTYIPGSKITLEKKPVRGVVSQRHVVLRDGARALG